MDRRSLILLGTLSALWGSSYMFIKIGLEDGLSPAMIVCVRTALGALALLPIALYRKAFGGLRPLLGWLVVIAVIQMAGPLLLISAGEQHISSALAGVLVAGAPIFTAILAPFVDRTEGSHGSALAGIAIGIVGVGLVLGLDLGDADNGLGGGLLVLLAALGYAIGGFLIKRRMSGVDPIATVTCTTAISAALTLPIALATAPDAAPPAGGIAAMAVLGVLCTGFAFAIFYTLIGRIGAARTALVAYIAPLFAIVYGATLQDETITVATVAGLVLILGGSWLAARRPQEHLDECPIDQAVPVHDPAPAGR